MTLAEPYGSWGIARHQCLNHENNLYTPSVASAASSVFSAVDGPSSQSSASSSVRSAALSWDGDSHCSNLYTPQNAAGVRCRQPPKGANCQTFQPAGSVVPPELRLHPRRTSCVPVPDAGRAGPPSLVRRCERKDNFVENLVDTTSQMIEVIWPLSVVPCGRDAVLGGKNLIGLRTFIQEVLKRSKTSYSTLQVALYYLVLVKPCIPKADFTKEQAEDSHSTRAMQCGRRMFLAALILASKYLQDRNYSARAWSKISGLKISEINSNEIAFLQAVSWKLHIPEPLFQRWTDIVLKYSLSAPASNARGPTSWRAIIGRLTPELDTVDTDLSDSASVSSASSPSSSGSPRAPRSLSPMSPPPTVLEPHPHLSPKITQLPTPQMTPGPPAASGPSRPATAMRCAMKQAQQLSMMRCAVDAWPQEQPSLISSPESMVSDRSGSSPTSSLRSSRASSISSVASTAAAASSQARLAVQATRRCAGLQQHTGKPAFGEMWSNVNPFTGAAEESYIRGGIRSDAKEHSSETAAAIALRELALAGANVNVNASRKRERACSGVADVDPRLQEQVEALLKHNHGSDAASTVAADPFPASSFLLNGKLIFTSQGPIAASNAPNSQLGARKRVRCKDDVAPDMLSSMLAPPSQGPGMWTNVL